MGVTSAGLIAVLTNFREDTEPSPEARSRGAMVNAFLTQATEQVDCTADFVKHLVEDGEGLKGVGGFSLVCGKVGEPLAIISNRTPSVEGTTWIMRQRGETVGLSNAAFADRTWTKVTRGEEMLKTLVEEDAKMVQSQRSISGLLDKLFVLLSDDTLPRRSADEEGSMVTYLKELRNSIFIPVIGGEVTRSAKADELAAARSSQQALHEGKVGGNEGTSPVYGTQKQSVVLVSNRGHVTFVERSLYDDDARPIAEEERDRRFEFDIEGWKS